jgi:Icc-related predicted phosphoesterase
MKFVFVADTHNHFPVIPDGDCVVHAGDACNGGTLTELVTFINLFGALEHPHKIYVPGNHDNIVQEQPALVRRICEDAGVTLLIDRGIRINGLYIYGTPWVPIYGDYAYMIEEEDLIERFFHIPGGLDLLITHGPPWGILDQTAHDFKLVAAGCLALRDRVLAAKPKVHVFGHIHPGYGQKQIGETVFINAACNPGWTPRNLPVEVEL